MSNPPSARPRVPLSELARPTRAYHLRAWAAMAGLAAFVVLYLALAAWFGWTAWRLTLGADTGGKDAWVGWIVGLGSAFLAVFMLKALFFVRHGDGDDGLEVTPADQPELFAFLHKLADRAGAPRPHRVFLSARVNAAVFYDLSLLNLVFPSRKNLEIGLGLVNSLTLGELRAVLAHEFGHFAQRSMAVGRWVYVAQQIAGHLVARRDKLDDFLAALSRFDIRVAWVGWILNLIVWSIRSLVDSAFQLVLLMQRALSREMEMNADLVAVSLTGSDALIHALHRLQAADDAWSRAVSFTFAEKQQGLRVRDLFAVQTHIVGHMGRLLNDSTYGHVPAAGADPKTHRVFKAELAQPPQMWLTHPLNHEREANAKRHYVAAPVDNRSAWDLFTGTQQLREDVTARLLGEGEMPGSSDALVTLDRQFDREHLNRRYRGVYFGRSSVRWAASVDELREATPPPSAAAFDTLYPASLATDMERLRSLERELEQLQALQNGTLKASGGVIRHRGRTIKRGRLPAAIGEVEYERADANKRLQAHDRRCRSLHRAAAATFGDGWPAYLDGLLAALHHAEHTEANLRDLQGVLANSVAIVTATRRVSKAGIARVVADSQALWQALHQVHDTAPAVTLDATLLDRLKATGWPAMLGTCDLGPPAKEHIGEWLKVVDGWVDHAAGLCGAVRVHALEQLLLTEAELAGHVRAGTRPAAAPAPSVVPAAYPLLVPGQERPRQTRLGAWGRFQTADGFVAGGARLAVAGGIVAAVLGFGFTVGTGTLMIYNGLSRPVKVRVGDTAEVTVPPFGHLGRTIGNADVLRVVTTTTDGREIERFDADTHTRFGQFVYNVAGAGSLVEWTAIYGNATPAPERHLGTPRWLTTGADVLFEDAPKQISTKGGGGSRRVLSGVTDVSPQALLAQLPNDRERTRLLTTHARWDRLDSEAAYIWLTAALASPVRDQVLAERLADTPDDVLLRRAELDSASPEQHAAVCERHRTRAASQPASLDWQYLLTRCLDDDAERDRRQAEGHRAHPKHPWFAYAAGFEAAAHAQWAEALGILEVARAGIPAFRGHVGMEMVRIHRLLGQDRGPAFDRLTNSDPGLKEQLKMETGLVSGGGMPAAYADLAAGRLGPALGKARPWPDAEQRLLRLAAASDGADTALLARARQLPTAQGLDDSTVWPSIGLALRDRRDWSAFEPQLASASEHHADAMRRFVLAVQAHQPAATVEPLLDGVPPALRGHGYSLAVVAWGAQAPTAWREGARKLLLVTERPYFGEARAGMRLAERAGAKGS